MKIICKRGTGRIFGEPHIHPLLSSEQQAVIAGTQLINWAELQQPVVVEVHYRESVMPTQHARIFDGIRVAAFDAAITSVHHKFSDGILTTDIGMKKIE